MMRRPLFPRLQKEPSFNVKEYRVDGKTSQISQVTLRRLYNYVKLVVSSFASIDGAPTPEKGLGIFGEPDEPQPGDATSLLSCEPVHIRDLRRLMTPFTARNQPAIIVRLYAILISMDPLRCIVLHDRVILLLPDGADSDLDELGQRLYQAAAKDDSSDNGFMSMESDGELEYEEGDSAVDFGDGDFYSAHRSESMKLFPFRAVEAVISHTVANLERELAEVAQDVKLVLKRLHSKHSATAIDTLDSLRVLKNHLATQEARAHMTKVALEDVLNDDEDMALMCFIQPPPGDMESSEAAAAGGDSNWSEVVVDNGVPLNRSSGFRAAAAVEREGLTSPGGGERRRREDGMVEQRTTPVSPRSPRHARKRQLELERAETFKQVQRQGPLPLSLKRAAAAPIPEHPGEACLGPKRAIRLDDHDVFELLFEAFSQNVSTVETSLELLSSEIVNAEQFHELCLTTARNRLLAATLGFTIISMCTGVGSFVGSIFGMNVVSGLEEEEGVFRVIAIVSSSFIVIASLGLYSTFAWAGLLGGVSQ
jgi:magnesium transporter